VSEVAVPERPRVRVGKAFDQLRIAGEIALAFVLAMSILFTVLTVSPEVRASQGLYVLTVPLLALGVVVAHIVRDVRRQRASARVTSDSLGVKGRDALWDRTEGARDTWRGARSESVTLGIVTRGVALEEAIVRELRAARIDLPEAKARRAVESAAAALGVRGVPKLYVAVDAGTNAIVAGDEESSSIVFGGAMLESFSASELLGVAASLLSRVRQGAVASVKGTIGGGPSWMPAARPSPVLVMDVYRAGDADAVLALRDPEPVVDALTRTVTGDPYLPGLSIEQAHLMWTWPSIAAPWLPETPGDAFQGIVDVVIEPDRPLGQRVEVLRLQALAASGVRSEDLSDSSESPGRASR